MGDLFYFIFCLFDQTRNPITMLFEKAYQRLVQGFKKKLNLYQQIIDLIRIILFVFNNSSSILQTIQLNTFNIVYGSFRKISVLVFFCFLKSVKPRK
ncbi:hypothetical protein BpHYR1_008539 [Brachionus plicatilis]|uniref:Uncharacterized protein n=1 Tax=Brachionus plicatilis TaxID=10195 RepID=A0A3M7T4Q1_BRAPC|nr:hypothetical protein BpHYR1_008539 [Brachionus plicatilis]